MDAVLRMTTNINTACEDSFDASAIQQPAYSASHKGGNIILIMKYNLRKNYLNFLKDVPMIGVNFTITVIIVSEKKNSFLPPSE